MFKHPESVCMTYFEHLKLSMKFSYIFAVASIQAFIHAILPDTYVTSTSDTVKNVYRIINNSGCIKNENV